MICKNCNNTKGEVTNYHHVVTIKNHVIEFDLPRVICSNCHKIMENEELDNAANTELIKRYNEEYGIPRERLIALRKQFNLSQEAFARIIGCAKKTLVSYETGSSIPNDIYMSVLKLLITNPDIIYDLLKVNENDYIKQEYEQVMNKINLGLNRDNNNDLDNLILFFAENGIPKTKIMICIYFVDYNSKKMTNQLFTNNEYIKTNNGIICQKLDKHINSLISSEKLERVYDVSGNKEMNYLKATSNVELSNFIVLDVKKSYKLFNVEQMINALKENNIYNKTINNKVINM